MTPAQLRHRFFHHLRQAVRLYHLGRVDLALAARRFAATLRIRYECARAIAKAAA